MNPLRMSPDLLQAIPAEAFQRMVGVEVVTLLRDLEARDLATYDNWRCRMMVLVDRLTTTERQTLEDAGLIPRRPEPATPDAPSFSLRKMAVTPQVWSRIARRIPDLPSHSSKWWQGGNREIVLTLNRLTADEFALLVDEQVILPGTAQEIRRLQAEGAPTRPVMPQVKKRELTVIDGVVLEL